jgi:hypothetical protein
MFEGAVTGTPEMKTAREAARLRSGDENVPDVTRTQCAMAQGRHALQHFSSTHRRNGTHTRDLEQDQAQNTA